MFFHLFRFLQLFPLRDIWRSSSIMLFVCLFVTLSPDVFLNVCGFICSVLGSGSIIVCVTLQRLSRTPEVSRLFYSVFDMFLLTAAQWTVWDQIRVNMNYILSQKSEVRNHFKACTHSMTLCKPASSLWIVEDQNSQNQKQTNK